MAHINLNIHGDYYTGSKVENLPRAKRSIELMIHRFPIIVRYNVYLRNHTILVELDTDINSAKKIKSKIIKILKRNKIKARITGI